MKVLFLRLFFFFRGGGGANRKTGFECCGCVCMVVGVCSLVLLSLKNQQTPLEEQHYCTSFVSFAV